MIPSTLYIRNGYTYLASDLPNGAFTLFFAETKEGTPTPIVSLGGTVVDNAIALVWTGPALLAALFPDYVNRALYLHRRSADGNVSLVDQLLILDGRPQDA